MGRELYREEQVFRNELDRCVAILEECEGWNLRDLLYPDQETEETNRRFREDFGSRLGCKCYEVYKHRAEACLVCPVALGTTACMTVKGHRMRSLQGRSQFLFRGFGISRGFHYPVEAFIRTKGQNMIYK